MTPTQTSPAPLPGRAITLLVCGILVVVGSLGPWATFLFVSANGTDGDGVLTLIFGVVVLVVAVLRLMRPAERQWLPWLAFVLLALSAAIGIYNWADISSTGDGELLGVNVGWGLVVTTLAAIAGAAVALWLSVQPERAIADAPQGANSGV